MRSGTKCRTIVDTLSDEIAAGRYRSAAFPSAERIVRRFNVSYATAVKALDELKRRDLVYSENGSGTFVKTTAGRAIGLMAPAWPGGGYFPILCREVAAVCQANGRPLLFTDTEEHRVEGMRERITALASSLIEERVSGVLYHPVAFGPDAPAANGAVVGMFREAGIPVVLIDSDFVLPPEESGCDVVGIDHILCGWRLGSHLLSRGARRILFVSYRTTTPQVNIPLHCAGLRQALAAKRGARFSVFDIQPNPTDEAALADYLARERPDAVACRSDMLAITALKAIRAAGLSVPDDIIVTGFGDYSYARIADPPLTTIRQPIADIVRIAFETLQRRGRNPDAPPMRVFLPAPLVERESTARFFTRPKSPTPKTKEG